MPYFGHIDPSNLSLSTLHKFIQDILCGISYCHSMGVIHGDIKPGNCLTDGKKTILIDFNLSQFISSGKIIWSFVDLLLVRSHCNSWNKRIHGTRNKWTNLQRKDWYLQCWDHFWWMAFQRRDQLSARSSSIFEINVKLFLKILWLDSIGFWMDQFGRNFCPLCAQHFHKKDHQPKKFWRSSKKPILDVSIESHSVFFDHLLSQNKTESFDDHF